MFGRTRTEEEVRTRRVNEPIRGGVSLGAILTGVVVAFGAFFLLSALIAGVIAGTNAATEAGPVELGIGVAIAVVVAQLLAYLWGGYTAGRMGRGAGVLNGLLVPVVAIVVGLIVAGIAAALGATANVNVPFGEARLPVTEDYILDLSVGFGAATLVAMFVGGILGGFLGARWHSKLETHAIEEQRTTTAAPAAPPAARPTEPTGVGERRPGEERVVRRPGATAPTTEERRESRPTSR